MPVLRFDAVTGRWHPGDAWPRSVPDTLVLTTFNVWFDPFHARRRYQAVADVLAPLEPDVMVFQEVTAPALDVLLAQPWIRASYVAASVTGRRTGNYGMLILSRLPLRRVAHTALPTEAWRGVLHARVDVGGRPLHLGCVHLDSGKSRAQLRERQLRKVFGLFDDAEDVILLGDFNMRDDERIAPPFTDVWPVLRPGQPGFTEDTSINLMRLDSTGKPRHVRFDRVVLKGPGIRAVDIGLLGTEPVSAHLPRVFPSDHFGVSCRVAPAPGFTDTAPGY